MSKLKMTLIAAACLLSAGAASAATPWDVFKRFGLTGNWSPDCSSPPSATNYWMTYKEGPGGKVVRPLNRGGGDELSVTVDSAAMVSSTTVSARFRNDDPTWGDTNGTAVDLTLELVNDRVHTIDSTGMDGTQYIKDGIVVKSGKPIPWIQKCGQTKPAPTSPN
jgi:hypothetical protein